VVLPIKPALPKLVLRIETTRPNNERIAAGDLIALGGKRAHVPLNVDRIERFAAFPRI
jgi:hypothetical protein